MTGRIRVGLGTALLVAALFALAGSAGAAKRPQTKITSGPKGVTTDTTPTFTFKSSARHSSFKCAVDGGGFSRCSSPETVGPLADGDHRFRVRARDRKGRVDRTPASRSFTALPGIFVSALSGSDANPGTPAAPLATIAMALETAQGQAKPLTIRVGEGDYPEKVTLAEGVSLLGGYDCPALPCPWTRNPAANTSKIMDQDSEGVLAGSAITRATVLDGFTIAGDTGTPAGGPGTALTVAGGSPTLSNNVVGIASVAGPGNDAYGIVVMDPATPPGPLIESSDISAGTASERSSGIGLLGNAPSATSPVAEISGNTIRGGSGLITSGINLLAPASGTVIEGNAISGGAATADSWGIRLVGGTAAIDSNLINVNQAQATCGSTTSWCGGIVNYSGAATITNNVVFGAQAMKSAALHTGEAETAAQTVIANANYLDGAGLATLASGSRSAAVSLFGCSSGGCGTNVVVGRIRNNVLLGGINQARVGIHEEAPTGRTVHPEAVQNNDFYFAPGSGHTDFVYGSWNGMAPVNFTTVASMQSAFPAMTNNISSDCMFSASFHIGSASPCRNAGIATEAPELDFEGDARPQQGVVDIGPDEFVP